LYKLVQFSAPGPHLWQIRSYTSTAVVSGDCVLIEHSRSGVYESSGDFNQVQEPTG